MRIADILFRHAVPGAFVADLTSEQAGLSSYAAATADLGLPYQRGSAAREGAPLAIVLHELPPSGTEQTEQLDLGRFADLASSVAHIVFFDRTAAFLEHGLIDMAARTGLELATTHRTQHKVYRFAAVFRRPEGDSSTARLRLIAEYRFDKLLLNELEEAQASLLRERGELRERLAESRAALQQLRSGQQELRAENQQLRTGNKLLTGELRQAAQMRDQANKEADELLAQLKAYEARLATTFQTLERSRKSFGFRMGLATWAAASGKNPFTMPGRFLRAFRGKDPVVEKLRDRSKGDAKVLRESRVEIAGIAKSVLLLGLEPSTRSGPGVAGVVGTRFADELAATSRFRALAPHNWMHVLEAESPAYVLVTADGLVPGAPWAGWGTPGGRSGISMLGKLVAWCRAMQLPVVYWDTIGTRSRLPARLHFDAMFTVSRRPDAMAAAEVLLPGVSPLVWNPVAVAHGRPNNPIYVGAFDRRRDPAELASLEAILAAAADRGLEILDSHAGLQGPLADTVRFPAGLRALARRRPTAEAERVAVKRAGILVCGNPAARSDFPSWDLLRGLAMGVHVLSTPAELDDGALAGAIELAGDAATARDALDRLAQRSLLDASWRSGFDRVRSGYSLGDRLDRIAQRFGAASVAEPQPTTTVIAQVRSEAELARLRDFVAAQTVAPRELRVLVKGEVGDGRLGDVIDAGRIVWLGEGRAHDALADSDATHLVCWTPGTPVIAEAVAELTFAAGLTSADVLALATQSGAPGGVLYRYGSLPSEGVVAVRRAAAADHLREGKPLDEVIAALAAQGTGCLIQSHPTASGSDSQRSVA